MAVRVGGHRRTGNFEFGSKKRRAGSLRPPLVTRFKRPHPRRSEGQCGQLGGRCSYRTASKTPMPTLNEQRNSFLHPIRYLTPPICSKSFFELTDCCFHAQFTLNSRSARGEDSQRRMSVSRSTADPHGCEGFQRIGMSVNTLAPGCWRKMAASGVLPSGLRDSLKAAAFPWPDASTQTCRAAVMAA